MFVVVNVDCIMCWESNFMWCSYCVVCLVFGMYLLVNLVVILKSCNCDFLFNLCIVLMILFLVRCGLNGIVFMIVLILVKCLVR